MRSLVVAITVAFAVAGCQLPYTGGARPVAAHDALPGYVHAAPTPIVRQRQETDCGLAALAMVAGAWGQAWSVAELARAVPPTARGVKLGALRDLARARGLDAYAIEATIADLANELTAGRPVVVGLVLPFARARFLCHFEVAIAIDPARGDVITLDPASGRAMRRTRAILEQEWARARHAALVVVGPLARAVL
ncbi:MAG: cysteine peptidase family C39 domain-containing protein [Proteobacteria bacterium]|nr:cysteine peptidase family C39 domain-containing protein [Pseudomonadota bacterium]